MADWSRFGRSSLGRCTHAVVLSTVNAGLERQVCESCGYVSVRFVEETVRIYPETGAPSGQEGRRPSCGKCTEVATFMVPSGFACDLHAWAMASRQDALGDELWIPIKIDQASNAPG